MTNEIISMEVSASDVRMALNERYPEANFGAIPVVDQYDAVEAYLAFDDGTLAEAPQALAAYVNHQRHDTG